MMNIASREFGEKGFLRVSSNFYQICLLGSIRDCRMGG